MRLVYLLNMLSSLNKYIIIIIIIVSEQSTFFTFSYRKANVTKFDLAVK